MTMTKTDDMALEIIRARNLEREKQWQFADLWQQTADLEYPTEDQITSKRSPGEDLSTKRMDSTAVFDSQDMASGLSAAIVPNGQIFFNLQAKQLELNEIDIVKRYLAMATERTFAELAESNFMLQFNESLRSLVVFGTNYLFSEFDYDTGQLNFKDFPIWKGQIKENSKGNVDAIYLSYCLSARQAIQKFGEDNVSEAIKTAVESLETESRKFDFIHYVGPRRDRKPGRRDNLNLPHGSWYVDEKSKTVVKEGGFEEFPFAVARWMKRTSEKYGRGQGTECLADVRSLQKMVFDYLNLCNRYADPPLEVLDSFEGQVKTYPHAVNRVQQMGSIKGFDQTILGNAPVTDKMLEQQRALIHQAFFRDIFVQLTDLRGDRRTTVEIMERVREGLRRLASPVARLQSELLNPIITRSFLLLVRNGRIPYPPPELQGQSFGVEYTGQLALALRDTQAKGFMQFATFAGQMEAVFPGATDFINVDTAMPDMALSFGVKVDHIATPEQVAQKRAQRAKAQQAAQAAQLAEQASKAIKNTSAKPEQGSPAGELLNAST
jgi:hypothetical protein